jgi:hypothetical protein
LKSAEKGQLSRYFQVTRARIGIFSNGRQFLFFSDLYRQNLMDENPFAKIDLSNLKSAQLEHTEQLSKSIFDLDTLLFTAERLRYLWGVKERLEQSSTTRASEWSAKWAGGFTPLSG